MDEMAMEVITYVLVALAFDAIGYAFGHRDGYKEGYTYGRIDAANVYQRYHDAIHEVVDEEGGDD